MISPRDQPRIVIIDAGIVGLTLAIHRGALHETLMRRLPRERLQLSTTRAQSKRWHARCALDSCSPKRTSRHGNRLRAVGVHARLKMLCG